MKLTLPTILKLGAIAIISVSIHALADDSAIAAGQRVIAIDSLKDMTVLSTENGAGYVVRDDSGNTYSNIARSDLAVEYGCSSDLCVGQQTIAVDSLKNMQALAIDVNGNFVVVDQSGNRYANISISDLAITHGCSDDVCVSQPVMAVDSVKVMTVTGLQNDGTFVVRDQSGNSYASIPRSDLALEYGCSANICVGSSVIALDSSKTVRVSALEPDGSFIVTDQQGNSYANIPSSDLAIIGQ